MSEKTTIFFGRLAKWDHMTDADMIKKDVCNPSHPEHEELKKSLKELYTLKDKIHIQSNLTYLLD